MDYPILHPMGVSHRSVMHIAQSLVTMSSYMSLHVHISAAIDQTRPLHKLDDVRTKEYGYLTGGP